VGDAITFSPQWSAMLLASHAKIKSGSYDKGGFSGTASVSYKPVENLTAYASYADTLQAGGTAGANTANEGETLAPMRSKQIELGLRYQLGGLNLGATAFDLRRPFAFTGPDNYYKVQGLQRNRGLELTAHGELTPSWSVYGGLTLLDAKLKDTPDPATSGKRMVGVPRAQASVLVQYLPPQVPGLALTGNLRYTGSRPINTPNTASVDGFYTVDLGARYATRLMGHAAVWRLTVNNLTNKRHWISIFPGNVNGNVAAGSAFLGDGREVRASMTMEF
jgi:iron complex outermembrane receptor protein